METAVPTLRVMRLQSPELNQPPSGSLATRSLLQTSLCLPDSLGVYVGENFTAYLGVLNSSKTLPIRQLTVSAQLQTPSQRWQLPSPLDPPSGIAVEPSLGVDAIVSHDIQEAGQYILRVEVGYTTAEGGSKTFRKFYRFNVVSPLRIDHQVVRAGDTRCFVAIGVQFVAEQASTDTLTIVEADFVTEPGLTAERIGSTSPTKPKDRQTAVDLLDKSGLLEKNDCFRYLFCIKATSEEAMLRGIGAGDLLGRAVFTWRKAMGETGRVPSLPVHCPAIQPIIPGPDNIPDKTDFVVHQSGLSVDVASAAAMRNSSRPTLDTSDLTRMLPVTVEPIDPPSRLRLKESAPVQFLVVNHSLAAMTLQMQFRLKHMTGLTICGQSFKTIGSVPPNGGSSVVSMRFMPLAAGLLKVQGCCVVDLVTGKEIWQPALFQAFVEQGQ